MVNAIAPPAWQSLSLVKCQILVCSWFSTLTSVWLIQQQGSIAPVSQPSTTIEDLPPSCECICDKSENASSINDGGKSSTTTEDFNPSQTGIPCRLNGVLSARVERASSGRSRRGRRDRDIQHGGAVIHVIRRYCIYLSMHKVHRLVLPSWRPRLSSQAWLPCDIVHSRSRHV